MSLFTYILFLSICSHNSCNNITTTNNNLLLTCWQNSRKVDYMGRTGT